ncbi:MAG: TonB-dependent receptor [Candidatus Cloacimonetes bacterium]|nr:TonB-dependent receptor [Candidatus Cloacimonadota bacterium]
MRSVTRLRAFSNPFFTLLLALLLLSPAAWAGRGKIKGKVIDTKSGEPAEAIVKLEGTSFGSYTDFEGEFLIPQVDAGIYTVTITSLNYHPVTIEQVPVASDQTYDVGTIKLTSSAVELETVIIVADKKKIDLGEASGKTTKTGEEISRQAATDVTDVLRGTAGFKIDDEGAIHVRGSRTEEVKYVINGIDSRDPLVGGQNYVNVDVANIEQIDVLSGGFGPEYGQAQAAVVKVTSKEGDTDGYHGRFEWSTDRAFDAYSFNTDGYNLSIGGPLPFQNNIPKNRRTTFFFAGRVYLTDTYLPYDIDRGSSDYVNLGIDLPERQKNEYSASLNISIPVTDTHRLKIYGERFYRRWDLYPEGEGPVSGNYGYPYLYNERDRPRAENNRSNISLTYTAPIPSKNATFEVRAYRSNTKTLISPGGRTPDQFVLELPAQEQANEDDKSAFLGNGYQDNDDNGYFDGYVDANNNGQYDGYVYDSHGNPIYSEGYEDLNRNGRWDRGEDWVDLNGNGQYDTAEPWTNIPNPVNGEDNPWFDPWDIYDDLNHNGRWDDAEPQTTEQDTNHNGIWDGERFQDVNGDGIWNGWSEDFVDANGNGVWDPGEDYTDENGNGRFDMAEGYDDINADGRMNFRDVRETNEDLGEPYLDGDFFWDTGEPFIDEADPITGVYNGIWDAGEVWFDLPSTYGAYATWIAGGRRNQQPQPTLNGIYDGPNNTFDEFELFTRFADFVVDPFQQYHGESDVRTVGHTPGELITNEHFRETVIDVSMPVVYSYNGEDNGSDWYNDGVSIYSANKTGATWQNRGDDPLSIGATFDPPNLDWDEWEPFVDYNSNGVQDGNNWGGGPDSPWGYQYNFEAYYDFFLNPNNFDGQAIWQERSSTTLSLETEYQWQINKYHDVLGGAQIMARDLQMNSIESPNKLYDGSSPLPIGSPYPERGNFRDFYDRQPTEGALFFRDQMNFEGMNVLVGMRWDFLLHEKSVVNESDEAANAGDPGAVHAQRGTSRLSPRLGISHPITESAKLYFNYGHFYQAPQYTYYYQSTTGSRANNTLVGNPNLKYEKTVEYQFGVEARWAEIGTTVNLQGYYRDIFDQITSTVIELAPGYTIDQWTNGDYGRVRGANISVEKAERNYSVSFNYELSFAYGKASSSRAASEDRLNGNPVNRDERPLDWDQTHSLNAYYSLYFGQGENASLFGFRLPDDWLFSMSSSFATGRPYTPSIYLEDVEHVALIARNSRRMPFTEETRIKFEKYWRFKTSSHNLVTGIEVTNLFNHRNVRNYYAETGNYYQAMHAKNPDFVLYYPGKYEYDNNPRNIGPGRNILLRFGYKF